MVDMKQYEIYKTGQIDENEFLFTHLVIFDSNMNIKEIEDIKTDLNPDYVSVTKNNTPFNFIHVTNIYNRQYIEQNGLTRTQSNNDLGIGIYVINEDDITALENLKDYIINQYDDEDNLLVIYGTYNGSYTECLSSSDHKGYIVLNENVSIDCINDIQETTVEDFLWQ